MSGKVVDINRKRGQVKSKKAAVKTAHRTSQKAPQKTTQKVHRQNRNSSIRRLARGAGEAVQDYSMLFFLIALLAVGTIMLYSTSSYEAGITYGDSAYYLKRQILWMTLGMIAMFWISSWNYNIWRGLSWWVYLGSLLMVIAVQFVGTEVNGAKRWLSFGFFSIQPAEISKIAVIAVTSFLVCDLGNKKVSENPWGWGRVLWPTLLQAVCIWKLNNNMSTALIVAAIGISIFFIARRDWIPFIGLGILTAVICVGYVIYLTTKSMNDTGMSFRDNRILAWLDPAKYADGIGFQTIQGLYGIGSGGLIGKGLGQSMQKLGYIPEAQNDMIFSIICEEMGLLGAFFIIALFAILCWQFMLVALGAPDLFGGLMVSGVTVHIAVQAALNIAVVSGSLPNTGVTLPFVSYGGSSVIILLAEIGIVFSVHNAANRNRS